MMLNDHIDDVIILNPQFAELARLNTGSLFELKYLSEKIFVSITMI